MKLKINSIIIALLVITLASSCKNKSICPDAEKGVFKDLSGLDGCSWVIELEDGNKLEPLNLADFDVDLVEDKKLWVTYKEESAASICMAGKTVNIECITDRNRD